MDPFSDLISDPITKFGVTTGHRWDLSLSATLAANTCHVLGIVSERYHHGSFDLLCSNFTPDTNKNRGGPESVGENEPGKAKRKKAHDRHRDSTCM